MKSDTFTFKASDGTKIFTYRWMPDEASSIKGAVQIAHGMAEHAARYERFAVVLTKAGYAVYANDHRGHGKTAIALEEVGYFADENGWEKVVEDMHTLTVIIKKENPNKPFFLFGHSMGSFLSRHYSMLYANELTGLILSGTGGDPGAIGKIGLFVAKMDAGGLEAWAAAFNLDPFPDMAIQWHSASVPPVGLNNCFYRNLEVDALVERLKTAFDRDEAKRLLAEVQRLVHDDEPVSFLNTPLTKWGVSGRIEGVRTSPIGLFLFWPGASSWKPGASLRS